MEAMEAKKKAKRTILVLRKKSSPLGPLQRKAKHSRTTQYEAMGKASPARNGSGRPKNLEPWDRIYESINYPSVDLSAYTIHRQTDRHTCTDTIHTHNRSMHGI
jgi:hypothetical protein